MKIILIFLAFLLFFIDKKSWAFSVENAIDFAIKNNPEIKLYEDKLNNSKNLNYRAIAEFLPKISLNIQSGERINNNFIDNGVDDVVVIVAVVIGDVNILVGSDVSL